MNREMSRDAKEDFRLIQEVRQFIEWIAFDRVTSFINRE